MIALKRSWFALFAVFALAFTMAACDPTGSSRNDHSGSERLGNTSQPSTPDDNNGDNSGNDLDFCDDPNQHFSVEFTKTFPAAGATDVSTGVAARIYFSHPPAADTLVSDPNNANGSPVNIGIQNADNENVVATTNIISDVEADDGKVVVLTLKDGKLDLDTKYQVFVRTDGNPAIQPQECVDQNKDKPLTLVDVNGTPLTDPNGNPQIQQVEEPPFTTSATPDPADPNDPTADNNNFLRIIETSPEDGESVTGDFSPVTITFNQPVDSNVCDADPIALAQTAENGSDLAPPNDIDVSNWGCELSSDGTTIIFTPDQPFPPNSEFDLTISSDNVDGAATGTDQDTVQDLQDDEVVHFVTNGPLEIVSNNLEDPNDPDKQVGTDIEPAVTFNQPVDENSVVCDNPTPEENNVHLDKLTKDDQGTITAIDTISGTCQVSDDGKTVTFTPDQSPLEEGDYRLRVDADGVQPKDENSEPLDASKSIEFTASDLLNNRDCKASVAGDGSNPSDGICLLGKDGKGGLVDVLLAEDGGPLAPLANQIGGKDKLADALSDLLESDDGSLGGIVEGLLVDGQLQDGLETLLLDEDGLQSILPDLLLGQDDGTGGVQGLVGEDGGVAALLQGLLTGTDADDCQSSLGDSSVCLVGKDGKRGALDTLLSQGGYLSTANVNPDELAQLLGNTLANDGSLQGTVEGLLANGQLQDGLAQLLIGSLDDPDPADSTLVNTLTGLLDPTAPDAGILGGLGNTVGGLLGLGGLF